MSFRSSGTLESRGERNNRPQTINPPAQPMEMRVTKPSRSSISSTSWLNEEALVENAAMTLEFLAWGRQRDAGVSPESITSLPQPVSDVSVLDIQQARGVVDFHRGSLTWMHNVIHWNTFYSECERFWSHGTASEKSWVALYYAVLALGVYHMNAEQHHALGIYSGSSNLPDPRTSTDYTQSLRAVSRLLYDKSYRALKEADFMEVHSVTSLKVIVILSLMAHSFDGSNLISVLLSCATRISHILGIHQLGPDPTSQATPIDLVQRELQKRIWMFLCIQDWLLIPFANSYTISPRHYNTPLPLNSDEFSGLDTQHGMRSATPATHIGYILIMYRVAGVCRGFYDKTTSYRSDHGQEGTEFLRGLYNHVLSSDEELRSVLKTGPEYLQRGSPRLHEYPPYVNWQRRTFVISVSHKALMIHQRFFLKSLKDKWYTYTRITCLEAARTILEEYYASFKDESNDMWTILAHVVSASIILLLDDLLSEGSPSPNRQLVCDCLTLIERSEKQSTILATGTRLIKLLLQYNKQGVAPDLAQIALLLSNDINEDPNSQNNEQAVDLSTLANEDWDWDQMFFNSLDMTFEGGGGSFP